MDDQKEAIDAYKEAGVELEELQEPEAPKEEPKEEPQEPEAPKDEEPKEEPEPEEEPQDEPLQDDQKAKPKRSIYDEYKDKKQQLKSERELREQAEQERDELKQKLEALDSADTPQERQDAQDDLEAFAKEINADPQALKRMRELFLKDMKPISNDELMRDLQEFKEWKSQNALTIEKVKFDEEFQSTLPALKEMLPKASDDEMQAVKKELDRLSHSKEYHDKDLDYIAWKHKDDLSALISPKKRGVEPKGRVDTDSLNFEFDPDADLSKLTPKQREKWEEQYQQLTKGGELTKDEHGRTVML